MDWRQLVLGTISNIIGVIIGFILASLNQHRITKKIESSNMESLREALVEEFKSITKTVLVIIERYDNVSSNRFVYDNSVWHSIIASGSLFKLFSAQDNKLKKDLFLLYSLIFKANVLECSIETCNYSNNSELTRLKKNRLIYVGPIIQQISIIAEMLRENIIIKRRDGNLTLENIKTVVFEKYKAEFNDNDEAQIE